MNTVETHGKIAILNNNKNMKAVFFFLMEMSELKNTKMEKNFSEGV